MSKKGDQRLQQSYLGGVEVLDCRGINNSWGSGRATMGIKEGLGPMKIIEAPTPREINQSEYNDVPKSCKKATSSKKSDQESSKEIEIPGPNDVLCGRGKGIMGHSGNQYHRELVQKYKNEFAASGRNKRKGFPDIVVDAVYDLSPPGRFLKQDSQTKLWYVISRKDAVLKTRKALREDAGDALNSSTTESSKNETKEHAKTQKNCTKTDNLDSGFDSDDQPKPESSIVEKGQSVAVAGNSQESVILEKNKEFNEKTKNNKRSLDAFLNSAHSLFSAPVSSTSSCGQSLKTSSTVSTLNEKILMNRGMNMSTLDQFLGSTQSLCTAPVSSASTSSNAIKTVSTDIFSKDDGKNCRSCPMVKNVTNFVNPEIIVPVDDQSTARSAISKLSMDNSSLSSSSYHNLKNILSCPDGKLSLTSLGQDKKYFLNQFGPSFNGNDKDADLQSFNSKDLSGVFYSNNSISGSSKFLRKAQNCTLPFTSSDNFEAKLLKDISKPSGEKEATEQITSTKKSKSSLLSASFPNAVTDTCSSLKLASSRNDYMNAFPEYIYNLRNNIAVVTQSSEFTVYCISCPSSKLAIKALKTKQPTPKATTKLDNEYNNAKQISYPDIRKPLHKGNFQDKPALALEWVEGKTIKECNKFSIKKFLMFSREILHAIMAIHDSRVVHNNLTADHIIVNVASVSASIIGFRFSSSFDESPPALQGDYHYMSPERTGMVNRTSDFRSDFYNLGVIFYYMLSGKLPFESDDTSELVHMHISENAQPLHLLDPSIPLALSQMVQILMKKNPEERYRNAKGILYDVKLMLSVYDNDRNLSSIALSESTTSETMFQRNVHTPTNL